MKATLYEALGIPQSASDEEVRAALRGNIRKYYARTRDGHGNVEEALRFINHASRILSDPDLRAQYDYDLKISAGSVDQKIEHVVDGAVGRARRKERSRDAGSAPLAAFLRPVAATASGNSQHLGLTETVTSFQRSTSVAIVLSALFGLLIAAAVVYITPVDALQVAKQVLVWLTVALVAMTLVYGVVHGVWWLRRRNALAASKLVALPEVTILNWRRDKSVFLGTSQPQEDAGWIFQLRMAELERAKSGRTSEPRLWSRLCARLFDYALWGLFLALPLTDLNARGVIPDGLASWLVHPLVAPVLITATWIPIEALLIAIVQTTPGKWLFGVYLQFSISDAYASRDTRSRLYRAARRAVRVWWEGMGCGFPLFAPVFIAVAYERVAVKQETAWDFAQDCLVTHGPPGGLNTVTGVVGLAAMLWMYSVAWHQTMTDSIDHLRASVTATLRLPSAFLHAVGGETADVGHAPPETHASAPADGRDKADLPRAKAITTAPRMISVAPSNRPNAGTAPLDPDLVPLFADRQAKIARLRVEGPRQLKAQNWQRAAVVCRTWADLDLSNADAWRCLGDALEGQGNHRDAVAAFRKARQYDPDDPTIERKINHSQSGILNDFLHRHGR
jgi:hypothetical protein